MSRKTTLEAPTGAEKDSEGNLDEDVCCLSVSLDPVTDDPCSHLNTGRPSKVNRMLMTKDVPMFTPAISELHLLFQCGLR